MRLPRLMMSFESPPTCRAGEIVELILIVRNQGDKPINVCVNQRRCPYFMWIGKSKIYQTLQAQVSSFFGLTIC